MFITFEGGEGSGKTTLIEKLKHTLLEKQYDVLTTREPGGSKVAEKIRSVLLDNKNTEITAHTEALLFAASRAQHLDEVIIPNLDKIILCDRYIDSSFAYQAFGRNLGMEFVQSINSYALKYLPDLTFYIDLDPKTGIDRVKKNRLHKTDRLDMEVQTFHQKVREGYLHISEMFNDRIIVIDGNQTIDAIYQVILDNILRRL
ncbi:dTMP kinase [Acholeplasma laidlawii]|uniref:dTMP kinase n=1 Tax=Acholeplasma laidlawii TaxID=2148 RepID=UPI0018C2BB7E|nr:dTMP kinase [Acholeplasma laidlawii]MBG0762890.1 dTMP kinase [Acholeplasma laidlawii]